MHRVCVCVSLFRVVCVGGDGMFSEVVHGLVSRTQSDSRVDQNQSNQDLVPCALCIGIIPAGERRGVGRGEGKGGEKCRRGKKGRW